MDWLNQLNFAKLEFIIQATQPLHLPPYKGSTFRGAFGQSFKKVVCINQERNCDNCILQKNCAYFYVFETENRFDFDWFSSPKLPHPYILEPPLDDSEYYRVGEQLKFNLILFGKAIDYLPYFIFVFEDMGLRGGIGKHRLDGCGRFWLKEVNDQLGAAKIQIYDGHENKMTGAPTILTGEDLSNMAESNNNLKLLFMTPTRIKHKGDYILFKNNELPEQVLLENIYRRAYLMTVAHCCEQQPNFDMPAFPNINERKTDLYWHDWQRYSNRQERKQHLGGFLGSLSLNGDLSDWLPLLQAGEILHVGSATSFGLGKYVLC